MKSLKYFKRQLRIQTNKSRITLRIAIISSLIGEYNIKLSLDVSFNVIVYKILGIIIKLIYHWIKFNN